ncbi:MAG: Holliday junction branch migration protein RuvA [Lachnospiraceae bacterium]|nr:Holliday junction branch migration protein RuvA [Lachnospiraceae bacterium]
MISFVRGTLEEYTEDGIVVEAGGIGYAITTPASLRETLPAAGEEVKIYTFFSVTQDAQKLYGFGSREEREIFRLLLRVSGIGPKLAVSVLSAVSVDELRIAVVTGDVKTLSRAPGLGKKTAEKLIVELKDQFKASDFLPSAAPSAGPVVISDAFSEAVAALQALGYNPSEALRAVRSVEGSADMSVDEILREAFARLSVL